LGEENSPNDLVEELLDVDFDDPGGLVAILFEDLGDGGVGRVAQAVGMASVAVDLFEAGLNSPPV
jgi:hypothetical protein